jgi:hypothetical protein
VAATVEQDLSDPRLLLLQVRTFSHILIDIGAEIEYGFKISALLGRFEQITDAGRLLLESL